MADIKKRLDEIEGRVVNNLKDFQRATVERIDELFRQEGDQKVRRVLVSDEVGLGKTLVAKGVIAKFAKMRKSQNDNLVKVVYICSNGAIAAQNLRKLRIDDEQEIHPEDSTRLSMQHLNIFDQESDANVLKNYIQLISLTPGTSFHLTAGGGTQYERALIYAILKHIPILQDYLCPLKIAMQIDARAHWNEHVAYYDEVVLKCDEKSRGRYMRYMLRKVTAGLNRKKNGETHTLLYFLKNYCKRIQSNNMSRVPDTDRVVGRLRTLFAQISLEKLEPDLIIMDEFQRFRSLLEASQSDSESDLSLLTRNFFSRQDSYMLLLSATPYKMYSTLEEIDELHTDEHYQEFFGVMNFLNGTDPEKAEFKEVWSNYTVQLKEFVQKKCAVLSAKSKAENALYKHICRTERISARGSEDIIDSSDVNAAVKVMEDDIRSYVQLQRMFIKAGIPVNVPIDYIKSCPYLLSFMQHYKLKEYIEKHFKKNPDQIGLMRPASFWLPYDKINKYQEISSYNARLEKVKKMVFAQPAEMLLWVPPSKPYYDPQGEYRKSEHFTKTLIFSSWEMVPRMLAFMLSYEAERLTVGQLYRKAEEPPVGYFHDAKKPFPRPRLNFTVRQTGPGAMSLLCLVYPSVFLTNTYNPIDCMNRGLTLQEIENEVSPRIQAALDEYPSAEEGAEDQQWYFMAPLMMDPPEYVESWLNSPENIQAQIQQDEEEQSEQQTGYPEHIRKLKNMFDQWRSGELHLGKKPADLPDILTDMALASPAVCMYRSLLLYAESSPAIPATNFARVFIRKMNSPEWTAVVILSAGKKKQEDAHWQNVLAYNKNGNLQAMLDEYAHVLCNELGGSKNKPASICSMMTEALSIRTTTYRVDTRDSFRNRVTREKDKDIGKSIRTHFSVAFIKGEADKTINRRKAVRDAFNSPFRPFVLTSTSIGQEGLDFHNYCRRIVHWNLPSNPIDLEQREGRINRFEGLVIRQNVAMRYDEVPFGKDIWAEMFDRAKIAENTEESSELIPYWCLTPKDNMLKIERIVPKYPYSRDEEFYKRLMKILSLYRLTLGQARQEELINYILKNYQNPEEMKKYFICLSPFFKGH